MSKKRTGCKIDADAESCESPENIRELLEAVPELNDVFTVIDKIGSGTFSSVYLARHKRSPSSTRQLFALKHLIPTSHPSRIENEVRCLKELGGLCNVVPIKACIRNQDNVVIIMPYIKHDRFQDYVRTLTVGEVQSYMCALLTAVGHVHKINVIHRDIKHSNFLFNRKLGQFALVDFGLAQKVPIVDDELGKLKSERLSSVKESIQSEIKQACSANKEPFDENSKIVGDLVTQSRDENVKQDFEAESVAIVPATDECTTGSVSRNLLRSLSTNVLHNSAMAGKKTFKAGVNGVKMTSPRRTLLTKRVLDIQRQTCSTVNSRQPSLRKSTLSATSAFSRPICRCFGRAMVCNVCLARSSERAPRAGTPGYRAPEVLMKYPHQTTAVDIWSIGVIFLSLLSGHYPIFKANDDMEALGQIICLFGSEEVKSAAKKYGKKLDTSLTNQAADLKTLCRQLRDNHSSSKMVSLSENSWSSVPDSAYDLLQRLLDVDPFTRISAADALLHPFFSVRLK